MKNHHALTVLGKDRVGIISAIADLLARRGINIADSSMTRLRSEFAMILLLDSTAPLGASFARDLSRRLPGLEFSVRKLDSGEIKNAPAARRIFSIKIYGADRIGIVAKITGLLASRKINVLDMRTRLLDTAPPSYVLVIDAAPPRGLSASVVDKTLKSAARRMKVTAELAEYEPSEL